MSRRLVAACRGEAAPLALLTTTELRLVAFAAAGWSNERIAAHLGMRQRAVAVDLRAAREAVGLTSERELLAWYWYSLALGRAQRVEPVGIAS